MPAPPDDAQRWLDALATRIEDDEALLAQLSDHDVDVLLQQEDIRASGVAAAVRRRVREVEAAPDARAPRRRIRWAAGLGVAVALVALAVWTLQAPSPAEDVLAYRADLVALAVPTKAPTPLAASARNLLAAAEAVPPDTALARRAAAALARAAAAEPDAAFFAALGFRLAGDDARAATWAARVPASSPYHDAASDLP